MRDLELSLKAAEVLGTAVATLCEHGADQAAVATQAPGGEEGEAPGTDLARLGEDIWVLASALAVVARRFGA